MNHQQRIPPDLRVQLKVYNIIPSDIVFYINSECNLRCKHCYIGNELLSQNRFFNLQDSIRFLSDFDFLDRLTILGGEPLLYEGFDELINSLDTQKIKDLRITTNLTTVDVINRIDRDKLKDITICVSLDGHNSETHDFIRGRGAFKRTIENLAKILEDGKNVEVTHTVMRHNIKHFPDFVAFCKSLGVINLNLHRMSLQGNALDNKTLIVDPSSYVAFCKDLEKMQNLSGTLKVRFPIQFTTQAEFNLLVKEENYKPHTYKSYYGNSQRIVLYSNGQVFISSEFFGTEAFVGTIDEKTFSINPSPNNELFYFQKEYAEISDLNPKQVGDENYPKVVSVSFKKTIVI
jgi:MoaA/NifB/PqqE/SkfB family radical SAM enzyme